MASFRVISNGVFVRYSPSAETDSNLFPPPLTLGTIVEQMETSPDGRWSRVQIKQGRITREGWVAARYLAPADAPAAPAATNPTEPAWMVIAKRETGVAGSKPDRSRILDYLSTTTVNLAPELVNEDFDWSSSFVNWCMTHAGYVGTNSDVARSWWDMWKGGTKIDEPRYGCIAVFRSLTNRVDQGQGHVGFFMEADGSKISILGGGQDGGVDLKVFLHKDLIGYLYPNPLPAVFVPEDPLAVEAAPGALYDPDAPYFTRLPNGRLYEFSFDERLQHINQLEAKLTDGSTETPDERAKIEQEIKDAQSDYAQATARAKYVAQQPNADATDAGGSPTWKKAWSWIAPDGVRGLYIQDPNAPFNDANHRNKPGEAQGSNIERVVAFLDVEHSARYAIQGANTFCTVYVYDATWLLSVEIPISPNRAANDMYTWLAGTNGQARGWHKLASVDEAQQYANQGYPVIAAQHNNHGAGHVALIRPVPADKPLLQHNGYMAQAGAVLRSLLTVTDRFGDADLVTFYAHS